MAADQPKPVAHRPLTGLRRRRTGSPRARDTSIRAIDPHARRRSGKLRRRRAADDRGRRARTAAVAARRQRSAGAGVQRRAIVRWHALTLTGREAEERIAERSRAWTDETGGDWAVVEAGSVAGRVSMRHLDLADGSAELGYWVLPDAAAGPSPGVQSRRSRSGCLPGGCTASRSNMPSRTALPALWRRARASSSRAPSATDSFTPTGGTTCTYTPAWPATLTSRVSRDGRRGQGRSALTPLFLFLAENAVEIALERPGLRSVVGEPRMDVAPPRQRRPG